MHNVGGVFVVLICGLTLAIFIAVLEFMWNSRRNAAIDRQTLCQEICEELSFALNCYGASRKLRREVRRTGGCPECRAEVIAGRQRTEAFGRPNSASGTPRHVPNNVPANEAPPSPLLWRTNVRGDSPRHHLNNDSNNHHYFHRNSYEAPMQCSL